MKLTIVSPCSPSFRAIGDITEPNKRAYAARWGFDVRFPVYEGAENDRGFGRLELMVRAIGESYVPCESSYVLWMGADTIFTNFDLDARDFIAGLHGITAAWDEHGLQSDVMLMRCQFSVSRALTMAWNRKDRPATGDFMADSDQGSLVSVLSGQPYRKNIPVEQCQLRVRVAQTDKTINRYHSDWRPGDFIFHTPGMPMARKCQLLKSKLEEIKNL